MTVVDARETPAAVAAAPAAAGMRELTATERQHLDRLRGHLASSGAPVTTLDGLGRLLQAAHTAWVRTPSAQRPDPGPMISSIAVGIGDLVLAGAPTARWVLHVLDQPSPALLCANGSAAVVPFADLRRRWADGAEVASPGPTAGPDAAPTDADVTVDAAWLARYVTAAASHLAAADAAVVPTPRAPSSDEQAPAEPVADPVAQPDPEQATAQRAPAPAPDAPASEAPVSGTPASDAPGHVEPVSTSTADGSVPHGRRSRAAAVVVDEPVMHYRTPTELPYVPSIEAQNLALRALDRGLTAALSDGPTPFALRDDGTNVHVKWFPTDPDDALGQAERWVVDGIGLRAAIGWVVALEPDGGLVVPGLGALAADESAAAQGADHAVVVLASDARLPGLVVAHRYVSGPDGRSLGDPLIVGPCPTLL